MDALECTKIPAGNSVTNDECDDNLLPKVQSGDKIPKKYPAGSSVTKHGP